MIPTADTMKGPSLAEKAGCWLRERWRAEVALNTVSSSLSGKSWLDLCNRCERIEADPVSDGRICNWTGSSLLTAPRIFPRVGARLLHKCLIDWPIRLTDRPPAWPSAAIPRVSFILPVGGGTERLPQFRLSVASLLAQLDCPCEIIVVEYSPDACYEPVVPNNCVYHHVPADPCVAQYNKAAAMNAGVRIARADVLVLLDADMLVPAQLAAWLTERFEQHPDLDAMRFARLIFNTDEADARRMVPSGPFVVPQRIQFVMQNTPMPLAIRKAAYDQIGGHDESFVGWGGEDVEFLSRLRTLRCSEGGRVPMVHVWHAFAPQKANGHRNLDHLTRTLSLTPEVRIARLKDSRCLAQSQ